MLLIVIEAPPSPGAAEVAAGLTGLALTEVRARLAGTLPRVLLAEPDGARARDLASRLEARAFTVVVCDPTMAPGDDDRVVARALEWDAGGQLLVTGAAGEREVLTPASLALIQRGVRTATTTEVTKKKERRLSPARALLTGGLLLTKTVESESTRTTSQQDPFLLLHGRDGQRDVIVYGQRVDYRFLGAAMQPTSVANFQVLLARLASWAPGVPIDERAATPGFLAALPGNPDARLDLALWLVWLAHLRRAV